MPTSANWRRHFCYKTRGQYCNELLAQTEFLNQVAITVNVLALEVREQAFTTVNHHDQTTAGVVIFSMRFEVTVQVVDASRQQRNLNFWGACVVLSTGIVRNDGGFCCFFDSHEEPFTCGAQSRYPTHREQINKNPVIKLTRRGL